MCLLFTCVLVMSFCLVPVGGQIQWKVERKVTGYGQDLVLFCEVKNCCSSTEQAGWSADYNPIYLDVRHRIENAKYDARVDTTGFSLVIRNLTKNDINKIYICTHGFENSKPQFLGEMDAFLSPVEEGGKEDSDKLPLIISVCVGGIGMSIAISILGCYMWRRRRRKRSKTGEASKSELTPLNREIPAAIQQMSEEDKGLYLEIIKSGTEIRYYIRIIIIGENGVGKTCLLRRLLGETIDGVESTDGVDIVHRCKIKLHDGKWVIDEVMDKKKQLIARIKRAINENTSTTGNTLLNEMDILMSSEELHNYNRKSAGDNKDSRNEGSNIKHQSINRPMGHDMNLISESEEAIDKPSFSNDKIMTSSSVTLSNQTSMANDQQDNGQITKVLTDSILKELSNFLTDFEKYDIPAEVLVDLGFWDFAGQRQYYPTHPVFLNPNAVHLLVADITKDIKQINTDDGFDKIGEYLDFWFDSIHSCRGIRTKKQDTTENFLQPPVIVVGTGIDKCKEQLEERQKNFRKQIFSILQKSEKEKHLRGICFVSNTEPSFQDFEVLRRSIFNCGKEIQTFGEPIPLRWTRLERMLDIVRDVGVNILPWLEIVKLCSECSIDNLNEINLFFKYQHKVGSVIYFENFREYVILNQKWLADAFRCLVTDKFDLDVQRKPEWKKLEDKGQLDHSLIQKLFEKEPELQFNEHKSHILNVMEIFGIIVKPPTVTDDENKPCYYMPCMISEQASISKIYDLFKAKEDKCTRTPWLLIQFDFMPFDFFNHIMCYYLKKYPGHIASYHGIGIFYLDNSHSRKFIVCFSKNTVAVQIWQWHKIEAGTCKKMLKDLESVIGIVKDRYESRQVSFVVKAKCADGNIHDTNFRKSYNDLADLRQEEYFCEEHLESHKTKDFFMTWFEDYSEEKDFVQKSTAANEVTAAAGSEIATPTTPSQPVSTIQNVSGVEDLNSQTPDGLSDMSIQGNTTENTETVQPLMQGNNAEEIKMEQPLMQGNNTEKIEMEQPLMKGNNAEEIKMEQPLMQGNTAEEIEIEQPLMQGNTAEEIEMEQRLMQGNTVEQKEMKQTLMQASKATHLSSDYKQRIRKNYVAIVKAIQSTALESYIDRLYSEYCLNEDDKERIHAATTSSDKVRIFLDRLMNGSSKGYIIFIELLKKDEHYKELAEKIEKTNLKEDEPKPVEKTNLKEEDNLEPETIAKWIGVEYFTEEKLENQLKDVDLLNFSRAISPQCLSIVGTRLGLNSVAIQNIEYKHNRAPAAQTHELLYTWKNRVGNKATVRRLLEKLFEISKDYQMSVDRELIIKALQKIN